MTLSELRTLFHLGKELINKLSLNRILC